MAESESKFQSVSDQNTNQALLEKERLEWLETFDKINELKKDDQTLRSKMTAKIKQNPFVPIGLVATTWALSYGVYQMKTGNRQKSQLMMRTRIVAQGLTIAALLIGIAVAAHKKST